MRIWMILLAVTALLPASVWAGPNENSKLAGHLKAHSSKGICTTVAEAPPCNYGDSTLVVHGDLGVGYELYVLALNGNPEAGIAGATFGIAYNPAIQAGLDILSWTLCADVEFPSGSSGLSWPDSGSGTVITWAADLHCQNTPAAGDLDGGVTAVLGAFYVYAYSNDLFSITPRTYTPIHDLTIGTCDGREDALPFPDSAGQVGFGSTFQGYDPCRGYATGNGHTGGDEEAGEGDRNFHLDPVFLELATEGSTFLDTAMDLRTEYGLNVIIGMSPCGLILNGTHIAPTLLERDSRIVRATRQSVPTDRKQSAPARIWNVLRPLLTAPKGETEGRLPPAWECGTTAASRVGGEYSGVLNAASDNPDSDDTTPTQDRNEQTSVYLHGDVGVAIIFPESNATGICPAQDWTPSELDRVYAEIVTGLYNLVTFKRSYFDALADAALTFWFTEEEPLVQPTTYEPIRENAYADNWRAEIMGGLGFPNGNARERERAFCNNRRQANRLDWYFIIWCVNNMCLPYNWPSPDSQTLGWANTLGPKAVLHSRAAGAPTVVHEVLHVFGAADEYTGPLSCTQGYGYLSFTNGNAIWCASPHARCVMDANTGWNLLCGYTRGQIGWNDRDGDGALDPVDPNSGLRGWIYPVSPGDVVDIYSVTGEWIKRIPVSKRNEDGGVVVWDGLDYRASPRSYLEHFYWHRNGSEGGQVTLLADTEGITLTNIGVRRETTGFLPLLFPELYWFTLAFDLDDGGTGGGEVRALIYERGNDDHVLGRPVSDEFFRSGVTVSDRWFCVSEVGAYDLKLFAWDVGGGHNYEVTVPFWASDGSVGVGGETTGSVLPGTGLGSPNPTRGSAVFTMALGREARFVEAAVHDVQGRLVRYLGPVGDEGGEVSIKWDGCDDSGHAVPGGKYYLRASTKGRLVGVSSVVVVQ